MHLCFFITFPQTSVLDEYMKFCKKCGLFTAAAIHCNYNSIFTTQFNSLNWRCLQSRKKHTQLHTVALKCILADYYLNNHHFLEQKTLHMMDIFTDIFVLSIIKLGHIRLFVFGKSEEFFFKI